MLPGLGLVTALPSARPSPVLLAAVFFLRPKLPVGFAVEFLVVFIELPPTPAPIVLRGFSLSDFLLLNGVVVLFFSGDFTEGSVPSTGRAKLGVFYLVPISVPLTPFVNVFERVPVFLTPINADLSLLENCSPFLGLTPPSLDL